MLLKSIKKWLKTKKIWQDYNQFKRMDFYLGVKNNFTILLIIDKKLEIRLKTKANKIYHATLIAWLY